MIIQKLIVKEVLRLVTKKFKLQKVLKYVQEPNELDEEVERAEAFKADDAQQLPPAEMEAKRAEEAIDVV